MKSIIKYGLVSICCVLVINWAIGQDTEFNLPRGKAYLGEGKLQSGSVSIKKLDEILHTQVFAKDTNDRQYKAYSFELIFAERNLYEDTLGRPLILADYSSAITFNSKVPDYFIQLIEDRVKVGDTLIFSNITSALDTSLNNLLYSPQIKLYFTE